MNQERKRVLVVEDEQSVVELLRMGLEDAYDFRSAGEHDAGVACLAEFRPHVVVLDRNVPGSVGLSFLDHISDSKLGPFTILISGNLSPADREEALGRGVNVCLEKPFRVRALRTIIDELIAGS